MTIDEIFSQVGQRMIEGLMTHSQLSDYFGFLGLDGYQQCHLYHYFDENCNYKKLGNYYLKHYNKIVMDMPFKNPGVINNNQYQYSRQQVTNEIRQNSIKMGFDIWVTQEQDTKKFYEQMYDALIQINETAAAAFLLDFIKDVDYELASAQQKQLELQADDYNMSDIIMEQDTLKKKYKKKLKEIALCMI